MLWNEELRVELHVARTLVPDEYRRRHEWFEVQRDRGVLEVLQRWLFYPTADEVVAVVRHQ